MVAVRDGRKREARQYNGLCTEAFTAKALSLLVKIDVFPNYYWKVIIQ